MFVSFLFDGVGCISLGWGEVREKTYESFWRCLFVRRCAFVRSFARSLTGWLVDGWLVGSWVRCFFVWLVGWLEGCLFDSLIGWLVCWLVGSLVWLVGWLVRPYVGSFARSFVRSFVRPFVWSCVRFVRSFSRPSVRPPSHPSRRALVRSFFRSLARSFVRSCLRLMFLPFLRHLRSPFEYGGGGRGVTIRARSEYLINAAHGPQSAHSTSASRIGKTVPPDIQTNHDRF